MKLHSKVTDIRAIRAFNSLHILTSTNHWPHYNFALSIYSTTHTKMQVTCLKHGIFLITPSKLKTGRGCPKCAGNFKKSTSYYKNQLDIWTSGSIILEEPYISNHTPIKHKHTLCGTIWKASPHNIRKGKGCPRCALYGFDITKPAILYYLKVIFNNIKVYKIGITNRTVNDRYNNIDLDKMTTIYQWSFSLGKVAREKEQEIIKKFSTKLYVGDPLLQSGNTELFVEDILLLDQ